MLDRLIDLFIQFITLFRVFVFVNEFDGAVVMRRGKCNRVLTPGLQWVIPLGQEAVLTANTKPEPMYLDVQSLVCGDGYAANIQVGIIWRITDIKTFLVENEDTEGMIGMLCAGAVTRSVQSAKWADLRKAEYPATLRAPMNRKVRKRGAEIDDVIIQDFTAGSADRLWHEGISIAVGED